MSEQETIPDAGKLTDDGVIQSQGTDEGYASSRTPEDEGSELVRTPEDGVRQTYPLDEGVRQTHNPDEGSAPEQTPDDADTFPRSYVEELRGENATYRNRAKDAESKADELAQALWTERVRSLGVLADPADLPYDPEALEDLDLIRQQADDLLGAKPHLRTRKITERAGQGERGTESISLVELLQRGA